MPSFGKKSNERLDTCHDDLQKLMRRVIMYRDCSIICGARGKEDQDEMFAIGNSEVVWPKGKHNITEDFPKARAVDVVPYPEQYSDPVMMIFLAGMIMGVARELYASGQMEHKVRWGGDWDQDGDFNDETFKDLWHFELIGVK